MVKTRHTTNSFTSPVSVRLSFPVEIRQKMLQMKSAVSNMIIGREQGVSSTQWCRGFTLIEMIVSLALFSIVITISVGALLVLVGTNEQLQGEQSVMTNLSFALDSMTREIRTGTHYYCYTTNNTGGNNNLINTNNDIDQILGDDSADCVNGNNANQQYHGIAFKEGGDSITEDDDRILYYFEKSNDAEFGQIFRRIGAGAPESILADGIGLRNVEFFVTGSQPLENGDQYQPTVTVVIEAVDRNDPESKVYRLQTSITQRTFDL